MRAGLRERRGRGTAPPLPLPGLPGGFSPIPEHAREFPSRKGLFAVAHPPPCHGGARACLRAHRRCTEGRACCTRMLCPHTRRRNGVWTKTCITTPRAVVGHIACVRRRVAVSARRSARADDAAGDARPRCARPIGLLPWQSTVARPAKISSLAASASCSECLPQRGRQFNLLTLSDRQFGARSA